MTQKPLLHQWIIAPYRHDQDSEKEFHLAPLFAIDCHRHHRGPYTGAGELVRSLVPRIYQSKPRLVLDHTRTLLSLAPEIKNIILSLAPEMSAIIGMDDEFDVPFMTNMRDEGVPHDGRTKRLAHGLIDFLMRYLVEENLSPCSLLFEHADMADPLDQEFLAILLRRARPGSLLVTIRTSSRSLTEPLLSALHTYASIMPVESIHVDDKQNESITSFSAVIRNQFARSYIEADCTSDDLLEKSAYHSLEPGLRQQLHRERAEALENTQQKSFVLGAIPYHYERAYDHVLEGQKLVKILLSACQYSTSMGYHQTTLDLGHRGRHIAQEIQLHREDWQFAIEMIKSYLSLDEFSQAEQLCYALLESTQDPATNVRCLYFLALLHLRFYKEGKRDLGFARQKIQEAVQFARLQPQTDIVKGDIIYFEKSTLALVEWRSKHTEQALQLLAEGLEQLAKELPERYPKESVIYRYNYARIYMHLGQFEKAIQNYNVSIELKPYVTDHYYERGNAFRALGQYEQALEDYQSAMLCSPPYPEVYYNRAGLFSLLGRDDEALDDYTHVLELDPAWIDARINRASIFYQQERFAEARKDIEDGLSLDPHNADLLCTLGLLEIEEQQKEKAYTAFSRALEENPLLPAAWINRGLLLFEDGKVDAAIQDFTQALGIKADATALYNRGFAYQSQERWQEAIDDYSQALALSSEDKEEIMHQRERCYRALGRSNSEAAN